MGPLDKQEIIAREIFRMLDCVREPSPKSTDLLEALLNGAARSVENVQKVRTFARKNFSSFHCVGSKENIQDRICETCDAFLEQNMERAAFKAFKAEPATKYVRGVCSILDELRDDSAADLKDIKEKL